MKCRECDLEMRTVHLAAYGYEVQASTGPFKLCGVEGLTCPRCGRMELRVKNPERLWKTEE